MRGDQKTPDRGLTPEGELTWEREKIVIVTAAAPVAVLDIFLQTLIPDLPLSAPFGAAILTQILLGTLFRRLNRPVEQQRLTAFVVATVLAASAVMVCATLAIWAMGWGENSLAAFIAGFGGTMFALYHIQQFLFRVMIERHDRPFDESAAT